MVIFAASNLVQLSRKIHFGNDVSTSYALSFIFQICSTKYNSGSVEPSLLSHSPSPVDLNPSARISDPLYLLGHSSYLFRASLPTLESLAMSKEKAAMPIWETLPDIPFQCSSFAAYDISLLAFACPIAQIVPAIHAYTCHKPHNCS